MGSKRDQRIDALEQQIAAHTQLLEERDRSLAVETALERVRAQALGMQQSSDILAVTDLLYREFQQLGFPLRSAEIDLVDEEADTFESWAIRPSAGARLRFKIPNRVLLKTETTVFRDSRAARESGASHYSHKWNKAEYEGHMRFVFAAANMGDPEQMGIKFGDGILSHLFFFPHGYFVLWVTEAVSAAKLDEAKRFVDTFTIAYTRFLELKAAEARQQQAERERSVERVRAEAMSMRSTEDLHRVVAVLFGEVVRLGIETQACGIAFLDEQSEALPQYVAMENPRRHGIAWTSPELVEFDAETAVYRSYSITDKETLIKFWRQGKPFTHQRPPEEMARLKRIALEEFGLERLIPGLHDENNSTINGVPFTHGLVTTSGGQLSAEQIPLVQDLITALEIGYLRYLDFEKLEVRNRQLEERNRGLAVETALERVRAQTLGMEKSADISGVCDQLFQEFQGLGFPLRTAEIIIEDEEADKLEMWAVRPSAGYRGKITVPGNTDFGTPHQNARAAQASGASHYTHVFNKEEHETYLRLYWEAANLGDPVTTFDDGIIAHYIFFPHGFFLVWMLQEIPPSELDEAKRFVDTFAFAHTRFLELEQAEARTHQAQIESAVERVRAEAMSMRQSDDINKVAAVLYKEIANLGLITLDSAIVFIDEAAQKAHYYYTMVNIRNLAEPDRPLSPDLVEVDDEVMVYYFESAFGQARSFELDVIDGVDELAGWKSGEVWTTTNRLSADKVRNFWETLGFGDRPVEHFSSLFLEWFPTLSLPCDLVSTCIPFEYGFVRIRSQAFRQEDADIVAALTEALSLGYVRFLDLQQLEDHNRLLEQRNRSLAVETALERVRAQTLGMQQSAEILDICDLVLQELQGLDFALRSANILIEDEAAEKLEMWAVRPSAGLRKRVTITDKNIFGDAPSRNVQAAQARGASHYTHRWNEAEYEETMRLVSEVSDLGDPKEIGIIFGEGIISHYIFFPQGSFTLWVTEEISAAELDEAKRFVDTFAFAYTRFLELEQAEVRTRQAQIEAALERIRAEVTGMRRSADIVAVVGVMWEELKALGLEFSTCTIAILDEERDFYISYNVWEEAAIRLMVEKAGFTPHNIRFIGRDLAVVTSKSMLNASKAVRPKLKYTAPQTARSEADLAQILDWIEAEFGIRLTLEEYPVRFWSKASFEFGELSLGKEDTAPLSDADMALLQRVADVFSSGYARYLNFQRLERDSAVERIRTQVFSMQEAKDLDQVVLALGRELQSLEIQFRGCGLQIVGEDGTEAENIFLSAGNETIERSQTSGWQANSSVYKAWDQQQVVYRADLAKDNPYGEEGMLEDGLRSIVDVPFRYGTLALNSENSNAFWPPDIEIFQAFAAAIEGAYARHLDFQQLEQQRQQARRESAVERVRAEAMSMRQSDDINKVAAVLYKEVISLGIATLDSAIIFMDEAARKLSTYYTFSNLRIYGEPDRPLPPDLVEVDDEVMVFYFESNFGETREFSLEPVGVDVMAGWKSGEVWTNSNLLSEDKMRAFWTHMGFGTIVPLVERLERFSISSLPCDLVATCVPFKYGFVRIRSKEFCQEDADIVAELTQALSLGYLRYLGFRRLEEEVAERQRAETAMRQAKEEAEAANRAKSQFLANMSHEIRTPMNAILGYAQLLQRDSELSPEQQQAVATIEKSGGHLLRLINDVLDLSKIEAGRLELSSADFDLHQLLHSLSTMFALRCEQKQLGWKLEGVGEMAMPVHGDEAKLSQVLINLLGNAVKFTKGGEVALHFASLGDHCYRFEVVDTGPGIDPAEQQKLFAAFEQGIAGYDQGGTGLGLSITNSLLELMDATLEVDSAAGHGARFFFNLTLPPARGALAQIQAADWSQVDHLKISHVVSALVVDDLRENREVLSRLLRSIGVEVQVAESGPAALAAVEQHMPDIIFMDIRMPGMDGMETARQLWQQWGQDGTKVVAISASVLEHERRGYLDAGFDAFIDKPFRAEHIYATMAKLLGVEYDYIEGGQEKTPLVLEGLVLPASLAQRLKEAAELTSVTELEGLLDEVEGLGEAGQPLAAHLRRLSQDFDMDEVIAVLGKIETS